MICTTKQWKALLISMGGVVLIVLSWILWGGWPDPRATELLWDPDAIVVLGGGDEARVRKSLELAKEYPTATLIVTGDGGKIVTALRDHGISDERIYHEQDASSTLENARFTGKILDNLGAERCALVTNWFHVPRSLAIFRTLQPSREWKAAFEARPDTLNRWDRGCQRRERVAAIHHLLFHQIWPF